MLSDYYYRIWQCGKSNYRIYDQMQRFIPIAYGECGYGSGDKQILEYIHQATLKLLENDNSFITKDFLNLKLMHIQIDRICQDLVSLLQRAINSYKSLLFCQRKVIKKQTERLSRLKTNEIISYGQIDLSTSATIAVISLCTSLDLSSKLIYFLNNSQTPIKKFKSSQSKHFSDMESIKENVLSSDELNSIKNIWNKFPSIKSLIQFRHDLIHNTTSLELERLYVGKGTEEICNLSMNYCFQPWRDCEENGQPLRYLGRNYFVGYNIDFEKQLCNWLTDVIQGHLEVGESLLSWITDRSERVDFELDF